VAPTPAWAARLGAQSRHENAAPSVSAPLPAAPEASEKVVHAAKARSQAAGTLSLSFGFLAHLVLERSWRARARSSPRTVRVLYAIRTCTQSRSPNRVLYRNMYLYGTVRDPRRRRARRLSPDTTRASEPKLSSNGSAVGEGASSPCRASSHDQVEAQSLGRKLKVPHFHGARRRRLLFNGWELGAELWRPGGVGTFPKVPRVAAPQSAY
jgi:hypothetical protein